MSAVEDDLTFGVISDVQYADHDDCTTKFPPIKKRYYRHGLNHIERAAKECIAENCQFILQLGDLIDGKSKQESELALGKVLSVMVNTGIKFHHALGNHELYNFQHSEAVTRLIRNDVNSSEIGYYAFEPKPSVKIICLDTYDIAMVGRTKADPEYSIGEKYLSANKNDDLNSPDGLSGLEKRFVQFNGGVSTTQLEWLKNHLRDSDELRQKVIVFGHICVNPDAASPKTLLWNYEEVLNVLESSQSVVVVLSGHYHAFKHIVSPRGKHYISIKGVIETPPSGKAWGIVRISEKSLRFKIHNDDKAKEWESLF